MTDKVQYLIAHPAIAIALIIAISILFGWIPVIEWVYKAYIAVKSHWNKITKLGNYDWRPIRRWITKTRHKGWIKPVLVPIEHKRRNVA
jgi:hypothetical protein